LVEEKAIIVDGRDIALKNEISLQKYAEHRN
jgi:hypothetical protein